MHAGSENYGAGSDGHTKGQIRRYGIQRRKLLWKHRARWALSSLRALACSEEHGHNISFLLLPVLACPPPARLDSVGQQQGVREPRVPVLWGLVDILARIIHPLSRVNTPRM